MQSKARFIGVVAVGGLWAALSVSRGAQPEQPVPIPKGRTHSKPFVDPVWGGSADPCMVWNDKAREYFVYYTARRADLKDYKGVEWMHGSAIGVASTKDGETWTYRGTCKGDDNLSSPLKAPCSWWAPHVLKHRGTYHMYVSWIDGIYPAWKFGTAWIKHFTGTDGIKWKFRSKLELTSKRCIDPAVYRIGDKWWMWYKDRGKIMTAVSDDLNEWSVRGQAFKQDRQYEAPFVTEWNGKYYMIVDTMKVGLNVYRSDTGTGGWRHLNRLWFTASHGGICQIGGRRLLVCHRRIAGVGAEASNRRRTQIVIAELKVNKKGRLVVKK